MEQIAFTCLAFFAVVCALGVVLSKNAVNGAMCLLLCLAGVAGLFIQLHAYLLAFILVLVLPKVQQTPGPHWMALRVSAS